MIVRNRHGERVELPSKSSSLYDLLLPMIPARSEKSLLFLELHSVGWPIPRIARLLGMHEKHVQRSLSRIRTHLRDEFQKDG